MTGKGGASGWSSDCICVLYGPRARAQMEEIRRQLAAAKLEADRAAAAASERERKIREVPLTFPFSPRLSGSDIVFHPHRMRNNLPLHPSGRFWRMPHHLCTSERQNRGSRDRLCSLTIKIEGGILSSSRMPHLPDKFGKRSPSIHFGERSLSPVMDHHPFLQTLLC